MTLFENDRSLETSSEPSNEPRGPMIALGFHGGDKFQFSLPVRYRMGWRSPDVCRPQSVIECSFLPIHFCVHTEYDTNTNRGPRTSDLSDRGSATNISYFAPDHSQHRLLQCPIDMLIQ